MIGPNSFVHQNQTHLNASKTNHDLFHSVHHNQTRRNRSGLFSSGTKSAYKPGSSGLFPFLVLSFFFFVLHIILAFSVSLTSFSIFGLFGPFCSQPGKVGRFLNCFRIRNRNLKLQGNKNTLCHKLLTFSCTNFLLFASRNSFLLLDVSLYASQLQPCVMFVFRFLRFFFGFFFLQSSFLLVLSQALARIQMVLAVYER